MAAVGSEGGAQWKPAAHEVAPLVYVMHVMQKMRQASEFSWGDGWGHSPLQ